MRAVPRCPQSAHPAGRWTGGPAAPSLPPPREARSPVIWPGPRSASRGHYGAGTPPPRLHTHSRPDWQPAGRWAAGAGRAGHRLICSRPAHPPARVARCNPTPRWARAPLRARGGRKSERPARRVPHHCALGGRQPTMPPLLLLAVLAAAVAARPECQPTRDPAGETPAPCPPGWNLRCESGS